MSFTRILILPLPESLADTPTADALRAICDLDLSSLEIDPPRSFGRD